MTTDKKFWYYIQNIGEKRILTNTTLFYYGQKNIVDE